MAKKAIAERQIAPVPSTSTISPSSSSPASSTSISTTSTTSATSTTNPSPVTTLSTSSLSSSSNSTITSPPKALDTKSSSSKLSGGATAGIAIGTFVLGVVLALLGFWFCMNRRKHSRRHGDSKRSQGFASDKVEVSIAPQTSLLDPVDDSTLKSTLVKLDSFIDQHVLSHYHEDPIQFSKSQLTKAISDSDVRNLTSSMPAEELSTLLLNPATRFHAIRRFIAWVILSNTQLDAPMHACLLPQFIVKFYNSFPAVEKQAGCDEAFESALTQWKHLSAFLLVPNRSFREEPKLDEPQIRAALDQNIKIIHQVLAPLIINDSKHNGDWEKNLRAIIFAASELGLTLFSQPSNWVFEWKQRSRSEKTAFVVFPALLQRVEGRSRPRTVCEAVVA